MTQNIHTPIHEDVRTALVKRCKAAAMVLGWQHPFFLPGISRIEFRAVNWPPTACVDLEGNVRVNPNFAAKLDDAELRFVIAHEIGHLMLLHHARRGLRDPAKWNYATDLILNRTLADMASASNHRVFKMPVDKATGQPIGIIADPNQADLTAEQLYNDVKEPPDDGSGAGPNVLAGCGVDAPSTDDSDGDGDGDSGPREPRTESQLRREWQEAAAQALAEARTAGTKEGNLFADLLSVPDPKVRWREVLRGQLLQALAEAGRDDVSWQRRSRRSTPEIIFPGGITYRCRAAVVIDTSGSMSDEDLATCVAETTAIVENCRVPVFLVAHDHAVQDASWIKPGGKRQVHDNIKKRMKGRGGTSFVEAYKRVNDEGRFNVMIHLTDGGCYGDWPSRPLSTRRLVVALVGAHVPLTSCPTEARVIEVEL